MRPRFAVLMLAGMALITDSTMIAAAQENHAAQGRQVEVGGEVTVPPETPMPSVSDSHFVDRRTGKILDRLVPVPPALQRPFPPGVFSRPATRPPSATVGKIRVYGWLSYEDDDSRVLPIRRARVDVSDNDLGSDDDLGRTQTDENGYWEVSFDNDCGPGGCDVYIDVHALNGDIARVEDFWTQSSEWARSSTYDNMADGDHDLSLYLPLGSGDGRQAFRIFDSIVTAWLYIREQTGMLVPQAEIVFPCDSNRIPPMGCPARPYFDPFVTHNIFMRRDQDRETHIHEWGHWVMWNGYDGEWPVPWNVQMDPTGCALFHEEAVFCDSRVAWSEGWATFVALAVLNDSRLESAGSGYDPGGGVEGRVAAALWDAMDSGDAPGTPESPGPDRCDCANISFRELFENMWYSPVLQENFRSYFDYFRAQYPDKLHILNAAAYRNSIEYEQGPGVVSLVAPGDGQWLSGSIELVAALADPDGPEGDWVQFKYSTDGTSWVPLPDFATPVAGGNTHRQGWSTPPISDASVWIKARGWDEVGTCNGLSAEAGVLVGVDNVPPRAVADLSSSHEARRWTRNPVIEMRWAPGQDNGAESSGVQRYTYLLVGNPGAIPDPCGSTTSTPDTQVLNPSVGASGEWYFTVAAVDRAGNCGAPVTGGPYLVDIGAPSVPRLLRPGPAQVVAQLPELEWLPSTDGNGVILESGVAGYRIEFTRTEICAGGACRADWDSPPALSARVEVPGVTFKPPTNLASGRWHWRVASEDMVGNRSPWAESSFTVDAPPVLRVELDRTALWPANHKLCPIVAVIRASDDFDADPAVSLQSILSNEPDNGLGDGDTEGDIQGADLGTRDDRFLLRAERSGSGNGRVYRILYRVADSFGNHADAEVSVQVAHDQAGSAGRTAGSASAEGASHRNEHGPGSGAPGEAAAPIARDAGAGTGTSGRLTGGAVESAGRDEPPGQLGFTAAGANPIVGRGIFRIALPDPGRVTLAIHDLAGRRVEVLQDGPLTAGSHVVAWVPRTGRNCPPGVYFARLTAGGRVLTRRIVVLE